ncbi:MAG: DUF975 family protein [Eubacteriales bacterium]|nr:DUF975 family protein [Eubacteriales bacterium]
MWTRADLKTQAKIGLKNYYWNGVLATFVQGLVVFAISLVVKFIPLVSFVLSPLVTIFVTNVIGVGLCSYFVKSTRSEQDAGVGEIFHGFQGDCYMRVVTVQFFRSLFTFLWTLLLIVPGIMKHYEYYMVPYLAVEYPEKSRKEIFQLSKRMMDGNKLNTFVLELSFIGWILLGMLACCVGTLFVAPYVQATTAELYLRLKEERFGIPREDTRSAADAFGDMDNGQNRNLGKDSDALRLETAGGKGYLVGIQGGFTGANIPIAYGETLKIGRDPSKCNVVIQGDQVSRLHLTVDFDGKAFRVTDLSTTGTFDLEKGPLPKNQSVLLQSGAYLQIGTGGDIFKLECK